MKVLMRTFVVTAVLLLAACQDKEPPTYQEQGYVFGTLVEVSIYGASDDSARQAVGLVMQEFQRLQDMLHAWQPNELSELNTALAKGHSLAISAELVEILNDVTRVSKQSKHLFNPAIGGLIQLWGFQSDEVRSAQPEAKKVKQLVKQNPLMSDLKIVRGRVESSNKSVKLDLGGYAKGYALDRAVDLLRKQGIRNALINIGGNIIAMGAHGKRPWRVGIQHPRKSGALASMDLHDGEAIGTSGDYQRYFMVGDVRYCHLIDPDSGYPVHGVQAVTVLTRGPQAGVMSDVLSKPLFISGIRGWRAMADAMELQEAILVDAHGKVHITAALKKRLEFIDKHVVHVDYDQT